MAYARCFALRDVCALCVSLCGFDYCLASVRVGCGGEGGVVVPIEVLFNDDVEGGASGFFLSYPSILFSFVVQGRRRVLSVIFGCWHQGFVWSEECAVVLVGVLRSGSEQILCSFFVLSLVRLFSAPLPRFQRFLSKVVFSPMEVERLLVFLG